MKYLHGMCEDIVEIVRHGELPWEREVTDPIYCQEKSGSGDLLEAGSSSKASRGIAIFSAWHRTDPTRR